MTSERIFSWTALKIAVCCLAASIIGCCLLWGVLTIPPELMLRPVVIAAAVLVTGFAIGFALRMQGGGSNGQ
jgi:hypothetical protein